MYLSRDFSMKVLEAGTTTVKVSAAVAIDVAVEPASMVRVISGFGVVKTTLVSALKPKSSTALADPTPTARDSTAISKPIFNFLIIFFIFSLTTEPTCYE